MYAQYLTAPPSKLRCLANGQGGIAQGPLMSARGAVGSQDLSPAADDWVTSGVVPSQHTSGRGALGYVDTQDDFENLGKSKGKRNEWGKEQGNCGGVWRTHRAERGGIIFPEATAEVGSCQGQSDSSYRSAL